MSGERVSSGNRKGPAKELRASFGGESEWRPSLINYQKLLKRIDRLESLVAEIVKARVDATDDGR
jgi:hypothetical protein